MDETQTRWFRWVADNAKYLFWGIWGAGVGTFAGIFFRAIKTDDDVLRIYLAILTAMMGGTLALVTARAMDNLTDARKRRRKVQFARTQMNLVVEDIQNLRVQLAAARRAQAADPMNRLSYEKAIDVLVAANRVRLSTTSEPDLEEIIESNEDVAQATELHRIYVWLQDYFEFVADRIKAGDPNTQYAGGELVMTTTDEALLTNAQGLRQAGQHFAAKAVVN